ncbi:MAG: ATPase, T2SS/T4P/T4SS family [Victivallaceae bacterium]|nr:ATPase, T2SS/T4P/T4SS family [Victivallaceae bacterium]
MSLELKWFIYVLIQHEVVTPEFALTLLARLGQEDTSLEVYAQQLFELLAEGQDEAAQSQMMQQINSFIEYAMEQSETGEEPPEIYELEIVDDLPDGAESGENPPDGAPQKPNGGGFDPFAGLGAAPSPAQRQAPPPRQPAAADPEFDDEKAPEPWNDASNRPAPARPAPPPTVPIDEIILPETPAAEAEEPDEDGETAGPSVEDIMAAFNRKHGGKVKTAEPNQQVKKTERAPATETTRSLKKVKVEAKVFNDQAKPSTTVDTVPLSLPRFFRDTARRTVQIDRLPDFSVVDNMNSGECAMLMMDLVAALRRAQISDLYVNAGEPVFVRKFGLISYLDTPVLSQKAAESLNFSLMDDDQKQRFNEHRTVSFSLALRDGRCRCNLRDQMHGISGSYHLAPSYIRPLEELGFMPDDVAAINKMLENPSGLIVVAGPAGSGRTTTLAAMVDHITHTLAGQVVMIENPIEIIQESAVGNVVQRELGRHSRNMTTALASAVREDPDVIVLSEIYNPDTIEQALRATDDGLLVIVSMFATSTAAVLARLMEVFEPVRRPEMRAMISGNLRGIVVQKLIPAAAADEQTVIYELMTNTPATAAMLVDGRITDVTSLMRNGKKPNMCTFDACVVAKYHAGMITGDTAQAAIHHPAIRLKVEQEVALAEAKKLLSERKKQN